MPLRALPRIRSGSQDSLVPRPRCGSRSLLRPPSARSRSGRTPLAARACRRVHGPRSPRPRPVVVAGPVADLREHEVELDLKTLHRTRKPLFLIPAEMVFENPSSVVVPLFRHRQAGVPLSEPLGLRDGRFRYLSTTSRASSNRSVPRRRRPSHTGDEDWLRAGSRASRRSPWPRRRGPREQVRRGHLLSNREFVGKVLEQALRDSTGGIVVGDLGEGARAVRVAPHGPRGTPPPALRAGRPRTSSSHGP